MIIKTSLCYIEKDGKYLMLFRNKKKNDINEGKWIGVGGKFEENETAEECLLREVKEETGLTLKHYDYRGLVRFRTDKEDNDMYLFTADEFEGDLSECTEGELKWIEKEKIFDLPLWEGDKPFLRMLIKGESDFEMTLEYVEDKCVVTIDMNTLAKQMLATRPEDSHKGNFGYIALVGGSLEYSGAIRLASMANAAMRAGAGVATVAAPRSICSLIVPQILESTIYPLSDKGGELVFEKSEFDKLISKYDCIAVGMGIGNTEETRKAVDYLLTNYKGILIIDADGLNALAGFEDRIRKLKESNAQIILTPHVGEFKRLITNDESAEEFALKTDTIVLLKGHTTTVTNGMRTYKVTCGCAGMATAGSGDVLSGILSAICASNKKELMEAVAAGAYINGIAGEIAQKKSCDITMIASDTAGAVKEAIMKIKA